MANAIDSCTSSSTNIPSDGSSTATITAVVKDGTTVQQGVSVTWSFTGPGKLSDTTSVTNASGEAVTTLTATGAGSITVTAITAGDATGKNVVVTAAEKNFVQSCISDIYLVPSDGSLDANLTAVVINESGDPVSGVAVAWAPTGVSGGVGTVEPTTSNTDADGKATTKLTVTAPGLVLVKATTESDSVGKSVGVSAPQQNLPPLRITNAEDNILDHYDIVFGVEAYIPTYPDYKVGDIVTFHWGETITRVFDISSLDDLPKIIKFADELPPEALADGTYNAYYSVSDEAQNDKISSSLEIIVNDGGQTPETLPAPIVLEADDGFININDSLDGVVVTVAYEMAAGDIVTVYWKAANSTELPLSEASTSVDHIVADGEETFDVVIDVRYFYPFNAGYEGIANVYYTVTPADSSTLQLSVSKNCRVDTLAP